MIFLVDVDFSVGPCNVVGVAVDLERGQVVYVAGYSDVNRGSNLRWLTDKEKNRVIHIALNNPEAEGWLEKERIESTNDSKS